MKNILLLVHNDDGQEARLQTALDLTRALEGHLTCIDVTACPPIAGDLAFGIGETVVLIDEQESEARNKVAMTARLAQEDVSWDWIDATGEIANCVLKAATLADMIVLNRALDEFPLPDMRSITSSILMHARKPVVAVPQTQTRFELGRALIAWDGGTAVADTMRACVPLLALASEVCIFMARDGTSTVEPDEAAEYLSRHGIHTIVRVIHQGRHSVDGLIVDECARWRADYILMGAYSHGRLLEAFGGVTRRMLARSSLPLVLGH